MSPHALSVLGFTAGSNRRERLIRLRCEPGTGRFPNETNGLPGFRHATRRGKEHAKRSGGRRVQRVGGGILVAIGLMVGSLIGVLNGQPSAGLLGGLVLGLIGAGLVWLWDSRRR